MSEFMSGKKAILITGCSSGIGLCAAEMLQARGYLVIATVRQQQDIEVLRARGLQHVLQLDLNSSASIDKAIKESLEITGGNLFALFNNGAFGQPGAVEDLSRETLRKSFETNLFGTHELTAKLLPIFLQQTDARIVQNSSVLGLCAMSMRGAYNATKFALEGLSDTLRMELHGTAVKVVLIEPGPILSDFRKNALRALQENLDFSRSRHKQKYEEAIARLQKEGATSRFTLGPEAVVDKLIKALEAPSPAARYYVTTPTWIVAFLKRFLNTSLMDRFAKWAGRA